MIRTLKKTGSVDMNLISSAATFIKQEFFRVLPPTIYFLVAFNIVVLTTAMVLKEFEVHISGHAAASWSLARSCSL